MMPRFAALSIEEISRRIRLGSGFSEEPAPLCSVRRCVTTLRLRSDRRTVCRARLAADFVLAIFSKATGRAGSWSNAVLSSQQGTLVSRARSSNIRLFESSKFQAPTSGEALKINFQQPGSGAAVFEF